MQTIYLHPKNPQPRLLKQIANALENGEIIAYPTQTGYALLTHIHAKNSLDHITRIKQIAAKDHHTLLCSGISDAANYAQINNEQFRHIKNQIPSITCFVLNSTKQTPKYLLTKDKIIGIQITDYPPVTALLDAVNAPLIIHELNQESIAINTPDEIEEMLEKQIDILVNTEMIDVQQPQIINLI